MLERLKSSAVFSEGIRNYENHSRSGGAGFIGSNFVNYIFHKYPDYRLIVLDALTYAGELENIIPDVRKS